MCNFCGTSAWSSFNLGKILWRGTCCGICGWCCLPVPIWRFKISTRWVVLTLIVHTSTGLLLLTCSSPWCWIWYAEKVLRHEDLQGAPLLILANKQVSSSYNLLLVIIFLLLYDSRTRLLIPFGFWWFLVLFTCIRFLNKVMSPTYILNHPLWTW